MFEYPYNFEAKIVKYDFGTMFYSVVYVPSRITSQLKFPKSKRLRIDGEIQGIRIEAALMPTKGRWYVMVSKKLQKLCGVVTGDRVSVSFRIANQEAITVPLELQFALQANEAALKVWESWTAGKRRGYCHRVATAKMSETKERRIFELMDLLIEQSSMN